ncbi:mannitol dehydrogenase family protein [Actinacidiphila alni]|uniref:mannitol dehydrogenase family protein n=1 Tax=Actinacidiphila alni TaxID=380248 RepID=UPI003455FD07
MTARLALRTLDTVPRELRPPVDPRGLGVGIVHLGLGAFHRAHQAAYTEDAIASAGGRWGICGVTMRSAAVVGQLAPQDGLYTVLCDGGTRTTARVSAAVRDVLFAAERTAEVLARIADPAVRVVTLTVTEKGYSHDPATGRLLRQDARVLADAADDGTGPRTALGLLVRGLQRRMRADAGPVTVLSCDNLPHNGATLRGLVAEFTDLLPAAEATALRAWTDAQVRFPGSMVDRIVPATTDADRERAAAALGVTDAGVVVTEPFRQWVIEDDFAAPRPAWERAGAVLAPDVAPYERVKLRMLNGSHSTLAYLGALAGCRSIADAVADDGFRGLVERMLADEVIPTLDAPDGMDLRDYAGQLLGRFANPALRHRTAQVAMDGSQKLPQRLLATVRACREAGIEPRGSAFAVAAWMRWVWTDRTDDGAPRDLDDPLAPVLRTAVAGRTSAEQVVGRLLALPEIFGKDLIDDPVVPGLLTDALARLTADGARAAAGRG